LLRIWDASEMVTSRGNRASAGFELINTPATTAATMKKAIAPTTHSGKPFFTGAFLLFFGMENSSYSNIPTDLLECWMQQAK
jgi:hypothetical protein